jgi:hypothetical protein
VAAWQKLVAHSVWFVFVCMYELRWKNGGLVMWSFMSHRLVDMDMDMDMDMKVVE